MTERSIFLEALEKEDPTQLSIYLDTACAGDASLRQRVEALLKSHAEAGDFPGKLAPERVAEELANRCADGETQGETPENELVGDERGFLTPTDKPGVLGSLGHYDILEVIGRGGMGVVLRAFDEKLNRVVAIKVMAAQLATNATARKRFKREAQAAAAVSHDHVVTIHAVEEAFLPSPLGGEGSGVRGLPYLVMQYVAGLSLQQRLDRDGPLQLPEILRVGMQTAAGLAAAHAQGLVHRDVKPANILLENGVERVKITDFGLARAAADASLTQSGVVAGTPQYMSPEQAEGRHLDQRSDLFSLGSVLYAMCTGRAPFRASGTVAVLKRVCEVTPRPVRETNPDIPDWLVAIIDKLHAKNPADRYQTAVEVAELLNQHLAHWFLANSGDRTHVVGELAGNPFGLCDTHGNVWEWVQDAWEPSYYEQFVGKPAIDPVGPSGVAAKRVIRGGDWKEPAAFCGSADRAAFSPTYKSNRIGFRVALSLDAVRAGANSPGTQ
jgi:serine/threonine protein kinase